MDVLRFIGLRLLGIARCGDDLRLLGAAVIDLQKRTRNIEAHLSEHSLTFTAPTEAGRDA